MYFVQIIPNWSVLCAKINIFSNLTNCKFWVNIVNTILRTLCTIREFSEEAQLLLWLCQLETTQTLSLIIEKKEPRQRLKPELQQLKNSSLEMLEHLNLSKEGRILIFKLISLLRNLLIKHLATKLDARLRSRLKDLKLLDLCQEREV